jgi:hypothetical protein
VTLPLFPYERHTARPNGYGDRRFGELRHGWRAQRSHGEPCSQCRREALCRLRRPDRPHLRPPASVEMRIQISLADASWTRLRSSMSIEPFRQTTEDPRSVRNRRSISLVGTNSVNTSALSSGSLSSDRRRQSQTSSASALASGLQRASCPRVS